MRDEWGKWGSVGRVRESRRGLGIGYGCGGQSNQTRESGNKKPYIMKIPDTGFIKKIHYC